jgi:hypothetical protein
MSPVLEATNEQEVQLSVVFRDDQGKPAPTNGPPNWSAVDPATAGASALVQLLPATNADGSTDPDSIVVWPLDGATGQVQVVASADADLHGGGPEPVTATFAITLTPAEASTAVISVTGGPITKRAQPAANTAPPAASSTATGS